MSTNMHLGNILEWAASYEGSRYHALLCDPPYHLTEITKRFGKAGSAPAQYGSDGAFQRASKGFMGKDWDGGDIAFRPDTWSALAELLYPGAWLMAFAGSRGYHRMACAIEDAGFIIQPAIVWSFGSGFPKATRIDTQIDRRAGATRQVVGSKKHQPKFNAAELGYREKDNGFNSHERESFNVTAPATELAQAWEGHRYGGQVLKPACEFICVAQKPYKGRPIDCITETGAGALNIDGARIPTDDKLGGGGYQTPCSEGWDRPWKHNEDIRKEKEALKRANIAKSESQGRWPANLILQHHPECNGVCHPACAVHRLGEQSGISECTGGGGRATPRHIGTSTDIHGCRSTVCHDDSGTAARYFYNSDWQYERMEASDAALYYAKASKAEREIGLLPEQIAFLRTIYGDDEGGDFEEDTIDDGRPTPIDNPYQRGETTRRNIHPTIKPISLARYLATLLLPPDYYTPRRLLIPFAGAGSEMIGAMLAGWETIDGIELDAQHVAIAKARLDYWHAARYRFDGAQPIKPKMKAANELQIDMFSEAI